MKSFSALFLLALAVTINAVPAPRPPINLIRAAKISNSTTGAIADSLVPQFGVVTNTNPGARQKGSCDGVNAATGAIVNIPCTCPPSRATFISKLSSGVAAGSIQGQKVTFSTDTSDQSAATNKARATTMLIALQNLNGAGVGCPAASAPNLATQQKTGTFSNKQFVPQ